MINKKIMKILAAIYVMRAKYWADEAKIKYDEAALGLSCAYDNAFDMLAYAATGNLDCLRQFGWSDEAEELINKVGDDIDFWDLEELIKKGE